MVQAGLCAGMLTFALAGGFFAGRVLMEVWQRARRRSRVMLAADSGGAAWLLQNGCKPLLPFSQWVLARGIANDVAYELVQLVRMRIGVVAGEAFVLSWALFALCLVALGSFFVSASIPCVLACACCVCMGAATAARAAQDKRAEAIRDEVPAALRSMSVCFKAGFSLQQTLKQVSTEIDGTLGGAFASAASVLDTGGSTTEALEVLKSRSHSPELSFVAVALDIQHVSGGSLSHVLEAARESVQSDIDLKRRLRVQTAQAKLSARIVTMMPFLLIALFSLISEGFLDPFFSSAAGVVLLAVALAMQVAGVLLVRRMLDVKVG